MNAYLWPHYWRMLTGNPLLAIRRKLSCRLETPSKWIPLYLFGLTFEEDDTQAITRSGSSLPWNNALVSNLLWFVYFRDDKCLFFAQREAKEVTTIVRKAANELVLTALALLMVTSTPETTKKNLDPVTSSGKSAETVELWFPRNPPLRDPCAIHRWVWESVSAPAWRTTFGRRTISSSYNSSGVKRKQKN